MITNDDCIGLNQVHDRYNIIYTSILQTCVRQSHKGKLLVYWLADVVTALGCSITNGKESNGQGHECAVIIVAGGKVYNYYRWLWHA